MPIGSSTGSRATPGPSNSTSVPTGRFGDHGQGGVSLRFRQPERLSGASGHSTDRAAYRREIRVPADPAGRSFQADEQSLARREPARNTQQTGIPGARDA